ncbi:MAG: hypothetical protein JO112_22810, partial [Planctomycetes bacterium]|nr:hypothetical protein [Planctomycetota bacterium]
MKKLLALALFLLTVVPLARAADPKAEAEARAKILAPFLDDETFAVVHLEVNPRNVDALVSRLTAIFKVNSAVLVPGKQLLNQWIADFNKAGGKDIYFLFNLEDVPLNPPFALVPLSADADAQALAGLLRQKPLAFEVTRPIHQVLFAGSKAQAQRLDNFTPMPRPEVAKALAAAGPGAAQFLLLPPASARRVIEEIMPTFPSEIGGGSTTILTRGVRWAALSYQTEPKLMLRLIIQSQDAESAQQFKQLVEDVLDFVGTKTPVQQWLPNFGQTAEKLTPEVHGDRLTLTVDEQTLS